MHMAHDGGATRRRARRVGASAWSCAWLSACVWLLAACAPAAERFSAPALVPDAPASVHRPTASPPPTPVTRHLLETVNQARADARWCGRERFEGAAPLDWDGALERAAEGHSRAMATLGFLDHVSPAGGTVGDRIRAAGYAARSWGETIAAGYVDPGETVRGFLDSPSHCAILMSPAFEALGAALVEDDASVYGSYWTLVFAAPR